MLSPLFWLFGPHMNSKPRNPLDLPERGCGGHRVLMNRQEHWSLPGREHLNSELDVSEALPGLPREEEMVRWRLGTIKHTCSPLGKGNGASHLTTFIKHLLRSGC